MLTNQWKMQTAINLPVHKYMTKDLQTVTLADNYATVRQLMTKNHVRHLPVVNQKKLLGMISHVDILKYGYSREVEVDERLEDAVLNRSVTIEQMMSRPVITIHESAPVQLAAELMVKHKFNALPVVLDSEELVGLITSTDILRIVMENI